VWVEIYILFDRWGIGLAKEDWLGFLLADIPKLDENMAGVLMIDTMMK